MTSGCWKLDEQDKALYIDLEEDSYEDRNTKTYSDWDKVPDILLEEIFSYLTIRERYYASLVCRSWYQAFKLQNVWSTFTLEDTTLTRGKFNYYSGWQYVLDHMRTSACINKVGRHIRSLIFEPMLNFYNLYEFMNMISWYIEKQGSDNTFTSGVGTHIRRLKFTFPCNMANRTDPERIRLFGTGGKLLDALKRLMRNLENLRCLELIDLMLDSKEAQHLMDDICTNCTQTLSKLVLINTTRYYCPLLHVGVFLNLNVLVISPQNLHEDVIELLGYTKLQHLHILQNRYSPKDTTISLPKNSAWKKMRLNNPNLKVHFEIESHIPADILLPTNLIEHSAIPCHSIVLDNPKTQILASTVISHGTVFDSIRVYAFKGLTRHFLNREFSKRLDEVLVRFCRMCPNLHTLSVHIREWQGGVERCKREHGRLSTYNVHTFRRGVPFSGVTPAARTAVTKGLIVWTSSRSIEATGWNSTCTSNEKMIRDKISTATILEIVSTAKNLKCLYVRRNVILKKCDRYWLTIAERSPNHLQWIKATCCSYENTEREVSKILGYRWHMLSEKEFQNQIINLHR